MDTMASLSGSSDSSNVQIIRIPASAIADTDVLCGRGTKYCSHPGNKRYHMICQANTDAYKHAKSKDEKTKISRTIVENLRNSNPPTRFIQRVEKGGDNGRDEWFDIGDRKVWEKTSQLLREMVSKGGHATVYQKRKWDKELKTHEKSNVKRHKSGAYNLLSTQCFQSSLLKSNYNTQPLNASLENKEVILSRGIQLLKGNPTHQGLAKASNVSNMNIGIGLRRLSDESALLRSPPDMLATQLRSSNYPSLMQYPHNLRDNVLNTNYMNNSIMSQIMTAENQLNYLNSLYSFTGRAPVTIHPDASSNLTRNLLEKLTTPLEMENAFLLQRQIAASREHNQFMMQNNINALMSSSLPIRSFPMSDYLRNNPLPQQNSTQQNSTQPCPIQTVTPPHVRENQL